ncbi:hypothetical protein NL676_021129 [Syzygium grande]|nr:hypothetical protein NL676_021129 [Syzygium grande]
MNTQTPRATRPRRARRSAAGNASRGPIRIGIAGGDRAEPYRNGERIERKKKNGNAKTRNRFSRAGGHAAAAEAARLGLNGPARALTSGADEEGGRPAAGGGGGAAGGGGGAGEATKIGGRRGGHGRFK